MSFKSQVKGRGSDRWWERRWWPWWGDMGMMRWTRRRVNRMKLTEWRGVPPRSVRWCISKRAVELNCVSCTRFHRRYPNYCGSESMGDGVRIPLPPILRIAIPFSFDKRNGRHVRAPRKSVGRWACRNAVGPRSIEGQNSTPDAMRPPPSFQRST